MRVACYLWPLALLPIGVVAQVPNPSGDRVAALMNTAEQAENADHFQDALKSYREAQRLAQDAGSPPQRTAEIALKLAHLIETWAAVDTAAEKLLPEAKKEYEEAVRLGNQSQRVGAQNNLGVLLLRMREPSEAQRVFAAIDSVPGSLDSRYLFEYNYGQALEATGNLAAALHHYAAAVEQRPSFQAAIDAEGRLLLHPETNDAEQAIQFLRTLDTTGQIQRLGRYSHSCLERWHDKPKAQDFLATLLRYFVAVALEPSDFEKHEWPLLTSLAERSPGLLSPAQEVRIAYLSPSLPVAFSVQAFPSWTGAGQNRSVFSSLLKSIGDYYVRVDARNALSRYAAAWAMDRQNPEYALDVATLLRDHRELDSGGMLFNQMVETLFSEKGEGYRKGDWRSVLRLHTILGTIFEREGKWGPRDNPRSAYWHWSRAIAAEKQLRAQNAKMPPSPGIHQHYAVTLDHLKQSTAAFGEFLVAAEGFIELGDSKSARAAWSGASDLQTTGGVELGREGDLRRIDATIKGMPNAA
jgi:tetratricopeptide (TPR) repeat protein